MELNNLLVLGQAILHWDVKVKDILLEQDLEKANLQELELAMEQDKMILLIPKLKGDFQNELL
jgi:hypothetical protein